MTIEIRPLGPDEQDWARARYAAIQFVATPLDAVALVAELDGARVGLGRLVPHAPGVVELGGIWTAEAARGQGVARAMVRALLARHAEAPRVAAAPADGAPALWCIPFVHLVAFYESFGFAPRAAPWPAGIAAKVADCVAHQLAIAVLARPAGAQRIRRAQPPCDPPG